MSETFSSVRDSMLSLEVIAIVKVAIPVCCDLELKREMLYTPCDLPVQCQKSEYGKYTWNEKIKEKTRLMLRTFSLPETLEEKLISAVVIIGLSMVIWVEYHESFLGFPREFSMYFLNSSLFTPQGKIDNKKAAKELMNSKCLNIQQKYKIACLYCFIDDIPVLFKKMSKDEMEKNTSFRMLGLVRYWSHYLKGEVDKIKGEKTRDQFMLEKAIEDGSKAAVEYCFEQAILKRKEFDIVHAALKALNSIHEDFLILFEPNKYSSKEFLWVPADYHVDIAFFLFSKMREDEQLEFLKIEVNSGQCRVLEYLLNWPYQDNFMKTANLMWDFLPERKYAPFLLMICDFIEPSLPFMQNVRSGEEKIYNYRRLLMEFWQQSPERFKRYVFSRNKIDLKFQGIYLLRRLLEIGKFTNEDAKIIELILASVMNEEKENMSDTFDWSDMWTDLMEKEKWKALDVLAVNWFSKKEEADKFKREFIFTEKAQRVCIDFAVRDKWNSVVSALKWSLLSEGEIDKLKKALFNSWYKREGWANLITKDKFEIFYKFVKWCFPSEEEAKKFKKDIVYSKIAMEKCAELAANEASEIVNKFIKYCFSSAEEINQFQKDVAYRIGDDFCGKLISQTLKKKVYNEQPFKFDGFTFDFLGGKWKEVEMFLTWCFSSEKEIYEFKRKEIKVRRYIHRNLILASQWEQAEIYFAWLGLSAEEIKDLKKEDFFNSYLTCAAFRDLFYSYSGEEFNYFYDFGNHQEAIELILRWYLTDRETALEFSAEFKLKCLENVNEDEARVKDAFKKFDLAIAQLLDDLEEEKIGLKRKSENSSSSKRFCN